MNEWSFRVPPDISVTIRARRKPSLLARCLGSEVAPHAVPSLFLELGAKEATGDVAQGRYRRVPWRCGVTPRPDGQLALSWRSPLMREYLALHIALLPALRRLLLQRDVALITGSAFESDGAVMLLSGETGSGKTALLLAALASGARLIGDEYVGIAADGRVTPVLRVLALRRATLAGAPQLRPQLTRWLMLRAAEVAARLSGLRLDPLVHMSPDELGIRAVDGPARLSSAFWLERSSAAPGRAQPMDPGGLIDMLARAQDAHDNAYAVPAVLRSDEAAVAHWREVLASGLRNVRCRRVTLPRGTLPADVLRQLIDAEPVPEHSA